jgi:hypothetical protein
MSEFPTHASWQIETLFDRRLIAERRPMVINFEQSLLPDESWFPKVPPNFIGQIVL